MLRACTRPTAAAHRAGARGSWSQVASRPPRDDREGVTRRPRDQPEGATRRCPRLDSIARSRSILASIGGWVENSEAIPAPESGWRCRAMPLRIDRDRDGLHATLEGLERERERAPLTEQLRGGRVREILTLTRDGQLSAGGFSRPPSLGGRRREDRRSRAPHRRHRSDESRPLGIVPPGYAAQYRWPHSESVQTALSGRSVAGGVEPTPHP